MPVYKHSDSLELLVCLQSVVLHLARPRPIWRGFKAGIMGSAELLQQIPRLLQLVQLPSQRQQLVQLQPLALQVGVEVVILGTFLSNISPASKLR